MSGTNSRIDRSLKAWCNGDDMSETYILQVKGESMIEVGILDGDWIIVDRNLPVNDGDIGVFFLENGLATVKQIFYEGDKIRLQPANKSMQPMYTSNNELKMQGKVVGIMRYYG